MIDEEEGSPGDETWLVQGLVGARRPSRSRSPVRLTFDRDSSDGEGPGPVRALERDENKSVESLSLPISRRGSALSGRSIPSSTGTGRKSASVIHRRGSATQLEWERQKELLERDADAARTEKEDALRREKSVKKSLTLEQRINKEKKSKMEDRVHALQSKVASLTKDVSEKDRKISESKKKWKMTEEEMQQLRLEYWEWKDQVGVARIAHSDPETLAQVEKEIVRDAPRKWPMLEKYMFSDMTPSSMGGTPQEKTPDARGDHTSSLDSSPTLNQTEAVNKTANTDDNNTTVSVDQSVGRDVRTTPQAGGISEEPKTPELPIKRVVQPQDASAGSSGVGGSVGGVGSDVGGIRGDMGGNSSGRGASVSGGGDTAAATPVRPSVRTSFFEGLGGVPTLPQDVSPVVTKGLGEEESLDDLDNVLSPMSPDTGVGKVGVGEMEAPPVPEPRAPVPIVDLPLRSTSGGSSVHNSSYAKRTETSPLPPVNPSPASVYSDRETAIQLLALQLDELEKEDLRPLPRSPNPFPVYRYPSLPTSAHTTTYDTASQTGTNTSINVSAYGNATLEITTTNYNGNASKEFSYGDLAGVNRYRKPVVVPPPAHGQRTEVSVEVGAPSWPLLATKVVKGCQFNMAPYRPPVAVCKGAYYAAVHGRAIDPSCHPTDSPFPLKDMAHNSREDATSVQWKDCNSGTTTPVFRHAEPPSFVGTPMPMPKTEAGQFTPHKWVEKRPQQQPKAVRRGSDGRRHSNIVKIR